MKKRYCPYFPKCKKFGTIEEIFKHLSESKCKEARKFLQYTKEKYGSIGQ